MAATKRKTAKRAPTKPKATKAKPQTKATEETSPAKEPGSVATLGLREDALEQLRKVYETHLTDEMGKLHNRFVAFISESKLPLPQVLIVLEILKSETIELARRKYMGE